MTEFQIFKLNLINKIKTNISYKKNNNKFEVVHQDE